jgi:hypothetical protein
MRYDYSYDYMNPFAAAWWFLRWIFYMLVICLLLSVGLALLVYMGLMMDLIGVK